MLLYQRLRQSSLVAALVILSLCNGQAKAAIPKPVALTNRHRRANHYGAGAVDDFDARSGIDIRSLQRGGSDAEIDKTGTWSMADLEVQDGFYLTIHGALLAAIVLFCRKVARTGGRAPSWITGLLPEPYATGAMHAAYFALGALLRALLPEGLSRVIFSPPSVALLGTVFPAVESVRAAVTDSGSDDRTWLMYWVIHGIFQYSTEFIDQLALKYETVHKYWHTFEVLAVLWLLLPVTDGATLIYRAVAQPYLVPIMQPIKTATDGWIAALALTTINASYIWWFSFIFMNLPVTVKRYAVMAAGSIFPIASTIMALASTKDNTEMRWLTYWPCFSLLFLVMIGVEKFVGSFKGLYVMCLAATMYLMLPMFDGSMLVFRKILVPLLGQYELLLLRDADSLAAELFKRVPADRQEQARASAAKAFLEKKEGETGEVE